MLCDEHQLLDADLSVKFISLHIFALNCRLNHRSLKNLEKFLTGLPFSLSPSFYVTCSSSEAAIRFFEMGIPALAFHFGPFFLKRKSSSSLSTHKIK